MGYLRQKEVNESPRRKRSGYHDGLQILLFAASGGEFNPKRLKSQEKCKVIVFSC